MKDKSARVVPFRFFPAPAKLITEATGRDIIVKARQIKISTAILGFFYFLSIVLTNQFTQIVSRNKQQTQYFLEIVRLFHETNSDPRKPKIDSTYDSKNGFRFLPNRSVIQIEAPTKNVGSGYTIHNTLMSEFSLWPFADTSWGNLTEAVPADGWIFCESQPFGAYGKFYEQHRDAKAGKTRFRAFEFRWPWEYGAEEIALIRSGLSEAEFARLYDCAFLQSGSPYFPWEFVRGLTGIRRAPNPQHTYGHGIDTAEGNLDAKSDDSVHTVVDAETGEQVYTLRGKWRPKEFARRGERLVRRYPGNVTIETNGVGRATADAYDDLGICYEDFKTTGQNKAAVLLTSVEEALREQALKISDEETLRQLQMFQRNKTGSGEAPPGDHDDCVMALTLAVRATRRPRVEFTTG